ncbi:MULTISPECIES: hypothetical protein [Streptomyces]|uniref:hypothetical protein n=1 Tax=Streptomyces TaxID=1883 RepID=UPI0001852760|nr:MULTISPECIES: hypothetical protein [Streptomyces]MYT10221.1 hypothetical protein [Streptomyces sp. SID5470]
MSSAATKWNPTEKVHIGTPSNTVSAASSSVIRGTVWRQELRGARAVIEGTVALP